MSFIFFILENEFVILKMYLDDFLILKKEFSHIRKRIFNIKKYLLFIITEVHFLILENKFLILNSFSSFTKYFFYFKINSKSQKIFSKIIFNIRKSFSNIIILNIRK